eukprot:5614402-Pyramimonas_sp.AAC.1
MWGHVFIDGSCQRHPIKELSRAAYAVCMHAEDGTCLGEARGPVWAHLPQTPRASEYVARCVAGQFIALPSIIYSDCASVVAHSKLPLPERYSRRRSYSGMIRQANNFEGRFVEDIVKVKAHLDVNEEGITDRAIFLRMGNADADASAKHALQLHPSD